MPTLTPRAGGRYLDPVEVIKRVKAAFAYVETTEEDARAHVLEWMNQLGRQTPGQTRHTLRPAPPPESSSGDTRPAGDPGGFFLSAMGVHTQA